MRKTKYAVVSDLLEAVEIELPNKGSELVVPEENRQNLILKPVLINDQYPCGFLIELNYVLELLSLRLYVRYIEDRVKFHDETAWFCFGWHLK